MFFLFFFFNDTATTEIYTLSLHDALPISANERWQMPRGPAAIRHFPNGLSAKPKETVHPAPPDRKSTRLNSSHTVISYAVFCLKKKNKTVAQTIVVPARQEHLVSMIRSRG